MGCGKSSVGRELSKLLCCPFMDLDDVIEERSGRRIPEIFATDGEAEFRRMEKDALELVFNTQEIRQSASFSILLNSASPSVANISGILRPERSSITSSRSMKGQQSSFESSFPTLLLPHPINPVNAMII